MCLVGSAVWCCVEVSHLGHVAVLVGWCAGVCGFVDCCVPLWFSLCIRVLVEGAAYQQFFHVFQGQAGVGGSGVVPQVIGVVACSLEHVPAVV